ncbi:EF hand domain-containing protein [Hasllibacter halocynthiae]|uniref:EF hand domain-containing protein n=1 Tax=Hasllibacter halocynthiae TaxID=595589 RepID=A0A2T0X978_9RHOB|nr:hypothetical protein [Hasllibacter halocynthiae]PRY95502.1 EF hand domain-containing protein [Hasllibacter halocynthiae]
MTRLSILAAAAAAALAGTAAHAVQDIADVDLNGDGFASFGELRASYPGLQRVFFDDVDTNDDNRIDASELVAPEAQTVLSRYEPADANVVGIRVIDADGDGLVSYDELERSYPGLQQGYYGRIDANGDGLVDANELYADEVQAELNRY